MKSKLVEKINKLIWTDQISNYSFVITHRGAPKDEKTVKGSEISEFKNRFLILEDGTMIPIHRIKRIIRFK